MATFTIDLQSFGLPGTDRMMINQGSTEQISVAVWCQQTTKTKNVLSEREDGHAQSRRVSKVSRHSHFWREIQRLGIILLCQPQQKANQSN